MRGHAAMLVFSALVAGSFSLGGLMANEISPAALTTARFGLAALIMGALALVFTGVPRAAFAAPWRYLVLGGMFAIYFVLMFEGLKTAPPVSTAAVFTLMPIMTAGFGWLLLRQVTTGWIALALAVGASGALWVIFRGELALALAFEVGRGEAIYFIGCIFHAAFVPLLRLLNRGEQSLAYTFLFMLGGFLLLLVWAWGDIRATDWGALPQVVWVALAYLAVFASAASFFLLQYGARVLPSAKVMAYSYLTPSWVILWEIALGHGLPPLWIAAGVGLTVIALLMLLRE
ncbi:Integral membrane protein [Candidatus Rhodobacter oscarellae]|uniref:Integral membrane protein n=2 Tax=Candidatus Rhodobacter oscarellae TaxID=1675527 RepID=A0A0J9EFQ8_9RHOB|nr:Integral membrane protein [Candidatus Rhodobacter lobularis]